MIHPLDHPLPPGPRSPRSPRLRGRGGRVAVAALVAAGLAAAALAAALPAFAAETVTYGYDARGRLVEVKRVVNGGNPVTTSYGFDKADNRVSKTTTGSPNPPPP